MKKQSRAIEIYILTMLVCFEAIGAIYGGFKLISDPSGSSLQLPEDIIKSSILPNYLLPGIVLLVVLGIFPLMMIFPLLFKPRWSKFGRLNIYPKYHWSWTYTLYTSIMLIIWIDVQILIIGYSSSLQILFAFLGVVMLILTLLPRVKKYYIIKGHNRNQDTF
jgi:hypothetical protein